VVLPPKPRGVAGLYDVTDDWMPIFDRTDRPGVFVAIGTSGNQFKTAPVVGELMLDLITANFDGRDTDRESVITQLPRTGRRVDTSVFSRLRSPRIGGSRG
jgi:sarcosine oxidase subunit beta